MHQCQSMPAPGFRRRGPSDVGRTDARKSHAKRVGVVLQAAEKVNPIIHGDGLVTTNAVRGRFRHRAARFVDVTWM